MADVQVRLVLKAQADGSYRAVIEGTRQSLRDMGSEGEDAGRRTAQGSRQAAEGVSAVERELGRARNMLLQYAAAAVAAFSVPQIVQMADEYASLTSKILLVSHTEQQAINTRQQLFELSQRTYSTMGASVELYSRMSRATAHLMVTEAERTRVVETINKLMAIGGASATEAEQAIVQLAQGMSLGALRGQDFNSVSSQAPALIDMLAKSLGRTTGELRKMAEGGELTTGLLVDSFLAMSADVDIQAAKVATTTSNLFTNLKTAMLQWVGESAAVAGGVDAIKSAIEGLTKHFDVVAEVLLLVVTLLAVRLVAACITAVGSILGVRAAAAAAAVELGIAGAATNVWIAGLLRLAGGPMGLAVAAVVGLVYAAREAVVAMADASSRFDNLMSDVQARQWSRVQVLIDVDLGNDVASEKLSGLLDESRADANLLMAEIDRAKQHIADVRDAWVKTAGTWDALRVQQQRLNDLQAQYNQAIATSIRLNEAAAAAKEREVAAARERLVMGDMAEAVAGEVQSLRDKTATLGATQVQIARYTEQQHLAAAATRAGGELTDAEVETIRALHAPLIAAAGGYEAKKAAQEAATKAAQELRRVLDAVKREEQAHTAAVMEAEQRERARVDALDALRDRMRLQAAELAGPLAKAEEEHLQAVVALTREYVDLDASADELADALQLLEERHKRTKAEIAQGGLGRVLTDLTREIELLEARNAGDLEAVRLLEIQAQIRQRLAQLSEAERLELDRNPQQRAELEAQIQRAYELQNRFTFDFGESLGRAVQRAFAAGSVGSGVRQFLAEFKKGMTGGIESALRTINSALDFAAPIADAWRNSDGNKAGAAMRALNQQLAQLPGIAGAVGQSLGLIDSLTGGKLFGTDWATVRSGYNVTVGAAGVGGDQFQAQERQRSLFRGTARQTLSTGLDTSMAEQLRAFFDGLIDVMAAAARAVSTEMPQMISGAYREVTDANGKVVEQFSTVLGRRFDESFQAFQQRLTAVNIIGVLDQLFRVPGTGAQPGVGVGGATGGGGSGGDSRLDPFGTIRNKALESTIGEASAIAARWIDDAAAYLEGARMLLAAATDIRAGVGLLGDEGGLTAVADLIESLVLPGESLTETYTRVRGATLLLEQATALMGVSLDGGREAFVRLAADISDAAGSLDRAAGLWQGYFDGFYSDVERAELAMTQAQARRDASLTDLGLAPDITAAAFREAFEAALPTLSAEQIVQWLEAAAAINDASAAQVAYTDAVEASTSAAMEALEAHMQALADYAAASLQLRDELADARGISEYQRALRDADRWESERTSTLHDLARAAGMAAAAEEDLVAVELIAAARREAAARQLEQRGAGLVTQIWGSALDRIDEQIAQLERSSSGFTGSLGAGLSAAQDGSDRLWESMLAGQRRIREYLDSMLLGPLGGLRPRDALAEGREQFEAMVQRALAGDADAANALPQLADTILRLGQQTWASGDQYFELRDWVRDLLGQVADLPVDAAAGPTGPTTGVDAGGAITALQAQREELLAQAEAARRRELAMELAGIVRDLMTLPNTSLADIEERLGFVSADLVAALGVNLDQLTVGTASQLAAIAQSMGVDLADLADRVGVNLGSLADRQSLLNDALEAQLQSLPDAQRDALTQLLRDVEAAAELGDNAALEAAQGNLVAGVNALPAHLRDALAPYFADVEPVQYTELSALATIDGHTAATAANTASILEALRAANGSQGVPGYEVGTGYVPRTGLALLHQGEAVLPAAVAAFFRREGIPMQRVPVPLADGQAMGYAELVAELRELRRERLAADAELARLHARLAALEQATREGARSTAGAIDRQTDAMRGGRR